LGDDCSLLALLLREGRENHDGTSDQKHGPKRHPREWNRHTHRLWYDDAKTDANESDHKWHDGNGETNLEQWTSHRLLMIRRPTLELSRAELRAAQ
jgi:hypothetical protein